jgi:thiol-disulfide isomerase/thioredoxin
LSTMHPGRSLSVRRSNLSVARLFPIAVLLAASWCSPASASDPLASLLIQPYPAPIPAPALSLERIDGAPLGPDDLRGKLVFLNFWATWCVPCRQEMPAMERLYQEFGKRGLDVVAVNFQESRSEIQGFLKTVPLSFPIALDSGGEAAHAFGVRGLPVTYLLDRDGRILWKAIGPREWNSPVTRAYFEKILQPSRP